MSDDPLAQGTVRFRQHGVGMELAVAQGLFSTATIDPGTRFLLRWLGRRSDLAGLRVLDLGCGYGPLAIWLAAAGAAVVEAVDRDAVALEFTASNAAANGVGDRVVTTASLGYDEVAGTAFDLVVSNVPAKVGPAALAHLLLDARGRLRPGGEVAVVVVERLADDVRTVLESDRSAAVVDEHANRGYLQVSYRFEGDPGPEPGPGFERGVYDRARGVFGAGRLRWEATTVRTLPEFDTLGHGTTAAVELLATAPPAGPVAVVGVGQGHLALALRAAGAGEHGLALVDRDLLALRVAAANLAAAASATSVTCEHSARPRIPAGTMTVVAALPEKEPVAVTAAVLGPALALLDPEAQVVLHGRAVDVSRVAELLGRHGPAWRETTRARHRGHAAARLRRL